jgi:hypothetical protein
MRAVFGHAAALLAAAVIAAGIPVAAQQSAPRGTQPATRGAQPRTPAPTAKRPTTPPAPRVEATVPFRVGETLTYDVSWSQYMVAGSAISRVVEKRTTGSSSAYYIVAEGRPLPLIARIYALYYKMDSLLDSFSTLSQHTSLYTEEGKDKRSVAMTFNRPARKALFEVYSDPPGKTEFTVPPDVQDGLATLYALRARPLKPGDRVTVPVVDQATLYRATFDVGAPEPVKVPMGTVNAWGLGITILDPQNQPVGNNIRAWITTDARRLPIKIQADLPVGNFILALRTAQ